MAALLADERPDVVFHLAAQIDVRRAVADPAFDAAVNVVGTVQRARGRARGRHAPLRARLHRRRDLRRHRRVPTPEDVAAAPRSRPTARRRLRPRPTSSSTAGCTASRHVALRLANVYGPRQDPLGEGGVIAIFCHARPPTAQCTRVRRRRQTRDFVYVGDVVGRSSPRPSRERRRLQHRHGHGDDRARAAPSCCARSSWTSTPTAFAPARRGEVRALLPRRPRAAPRSAGGRGRRSPTDCGETWESIGRGREGARRGTERIQASRGHSLPPVSLSPWRRATLVASRSPPRELVDPRRPRRQSPREAGLPTRNARPRRRRSSRP